MCPEVWRARVHGGILDGLTSLGRSDDACWLWLEPPATTSGLGFMRGLAAAVHRRAQALAESRHHSLSATVTDLIILAANAVIALVSAEYEHPGRVTAWIAHVDNVALRPIPEGAMIRYLIRVGEAAATASLLLKTLRA